MGVERCVRVPACEEPATWTKPQGATGGVPGVNGVGPLQGTHTHRYVSTAVQGGVGCSEEAAPGAGAFRNPLPA
jgi:hypothetical protein